MRLKIRLQFLVLILFLFLLLFNIFFNSPKVTAQEDAPILIITPENGYVLDANQRFSVKVTINTSEGEEVEGANVAIQSLIGDEYSSTTNSEGRAYLTAPKNRDKITIIATKSGFIAATRELEINPEPNLFDQIIKNQYFIVFLAFLFLVLAVIFVNYRQKKSILKITKENSEGKKLEEHGLEKIQQSSNKKDEDSPNNKIEEIRIVQPRQKNNVVSIEAKKEENEKEETKPEDWFDGTDEVRYEIDRLTGEIDEEGKDKWFEGVENIREKLDEKMKKKRKKEEDENGKKE